MDLYQKTVSSEKLYNGKIITLERLMVELPNKEIVERAVIRHPGASVIIPITDDGHVIMVKQFRKAADEILLEMPAGTLNNGEDPLECAKRELEEETGFTAGKFEHVMSFFTCPGFCDEIIHAYVATELKPGRLNPDEDEFLENVKIKISDLLEMMYSNKIKLDAKSIICAHIAKNYM